jgi:hypothetical protein
LFTQTSSDIGFLLQFFPFAILSAIIQNKGNQQTFSYLVSAGNVLRVTSMRPDDSSAESMNVKVRYDKGQKGCFLLSSQTTY